MNRLEAKLAAEIRAEGPVGIDRLMTLTVSHYYATRDPFGAEGDFVTAPEVSQVFGELLGLWAIDQWQRLGCPVPCKLIELGPGRGTLMSDVLRALNLVPALRQAIELHLVETSDTLSARQAETLARDHPDVSPRWHRALADVPDGAMLLFANEFFDALPIRQWIRDQDGWRERQVTVDSANRFQFRAGPTTTPPVTPPSESEAGDLFETCAPALGIAREIGRRLRAAPGAAVLIDYGHARSGVGETLQALRHHRYAPVLDDLGEADLTAHVDFAALAAALEAGGASVSTLVGQGRFLLGLGADLRLEVLLRGKDAASQQELKEGVRRLLDPSEMGRLFKVLVATSPERSQP